MSQRLTVSDALELLVLVRRLHDFRIDFDDGYFGGNDAGIVLGCRDRPFLGSVRKPRRGRQPERPQRLRPGENDDLRIAACTRVINSRDQPTRTIAVRLNKRGIAWNNKNNDDKAMADYSQLIRTDPKFSGSWQNRAQLYQYRKQYDKGIADFNEAIKLDPQRRGPVQGDAPIAGTTRRSTTRRSSTTARRSGSIQRRLLLLWPRRGLRSKKDYDRSIADYNEAIKLDSKFKTALHRARQRVGEKGRP